MDTDLYFDRQRTLNEKFGILSNIFRCLAVGAVCLYVFNILSLFMDDSYSGTMIYPFTGVILQDVFLTGTASSVLASFFYRYIDGYVPIHPDELKVFLNRHKKHDDVIDYLNTVIDAGVLLRRCHIKKAEEVAELIKDRNRKMEQNKVICELLNGAPPTDNQGKHKNYV